MSGNENYNDIDFEYNITNIKDKTDNYEEEELIEKLDLLEKKWCENYDNLSIIEIIKKCLNKFKLNENYTKEELENAFDRCKYYILHINYNFQNNNMIDVEDTDNEYLLKFNKIFETLYYTYRTLLNGLLLNYSTTNNQEQILNTDIGLFRFVPIDYENNNPQQNLILYALSVLYEKGYRRYGEYCYKPIFDSNKKYTYSWEKVIDIDTFVLKICDKDLNYEQWKNLTNTRDTGKSVQDYLKKCEEKQFPELKKNRNMFSFKNGLYLSIDDKEYKKNNNIIDKFIPHGEKCNIKDNNVSCKYFDLDFPTDNYDNWEKIPTPVLISILKYQYHDHEEYESICKTIFILIGRCLYELNYLDGWQVILFFMGMAGTGKSTIITKVIKEFYEKDDVGQLSNDGEKTFGLSAFYNKLLFIAPEVKQDFNLPQASFQSMISGEDVSVALKFKTAENVEWNVPGVLAGNEPPGYVDNAGSMSRRLVVAKFSKKVKKDKLDTQLGKKLQQEIPYILLKSNRAYHEAIKSYGSKDIWPHLPKYFRKQQQSMAEDTNSLTSFLGSGKVVFNSSYYCLEKTFKQELQQYCQENNLKNKSWNSTFYDGPLHDAALRYGTHIEIVRQQRKRYPRPNGDKKHGTFILGLDIMLDQDSDSDDNDEINNL